MPSQLTLLAFFLASLTAGIPNPQTSQNTTTHLLNSVTPDISAHALAKRTTANPPFDPWSFNRNEHRTDGEFEGDIFRLSKCYCIDTPSRNLPPIYGQFYGSYYGFDYYNYHQNKSYDFSWTCASGKFVTVNSIGGPNDHEHYDVPKCLGWMEEEKKQCWATDDGNEFCGEVKKGKDYYYWNGQKRKVRNHPAASGTKNTSVPHLDDECQRMCETVPARTVGWMQDTIPSNHSNKINLATATVCDPRSAVGMGVSCGGETPKVWETWNYIETYSDQADMCKGCA